MCLVFISLIANCKQCNVKLEVNSTKKITCLFFKCVSVGAISTNIYAVELSDWLVFVYANF